jgi:Tfp pilus assembly protein PilN
MRAIDLMPTACRESLGRRAMIRRWTLVYCGTVALIVAASWALRFGETIRSRERDSLSEQVKVNWSRSEVVQRLIKEITEVEAAITRYNTLAWPVRAHEVVETIGAVMPPEVALTDLAITPRQEQRTARQRPPSGRGKPEEQEPERFFMVIEMEGVAPDDEPVARFVQGLETSPLFSRVALDYTRTRALESGDVRGFRVTCEVDLSTRYSFVSATATGGEE